MFYGVTLVAAGPAGASAVFAAALTLLCAGAAVGAVHGAALVRIVAGEIHADARVDAGPQAFRPVR